MARLWSSGFELNSIADEMSATGASGATIATSSTVAHSGTYSLKAAITSSGSCDATMVVNANGLGTIFIRTYIYVTTLPNTNTTILYVDDDANGDNAGGIYMNSSGGVGITTYAGANSNPPTYHTATSAISLNTWHYIELEIVATSANAQTVTGRLDGTQFDSQSGTSTLPANAMTTPYFGIAIDGNETATSGVIYFDDVAVNDNTGSFQNTWPGVGSITHQRPAAAGDNNAFTVQVGGTAGAANNYTRVNEVTPDDATSYNGDITSGDIDDFAVGSTSIGASDTVNVVSVGVRYRAAIASAEATFKARIKKTSGGTVSSSAGIKPTSTTWTTNANAVAKVYPITLYNDPDGNPWTATTLNSAQIGYTISTTGTNAVDVSTVWMLVDSTPAGSALSITVSDTTTTSEAIDVLRANSRDLNVNDTTTTSESIGIKTDNNPKVSDTTTTSENITVTITSPLKVSDTTVTSENTSLLNIENISTSDTTLTSEDVTVTIPVAGIDNINVSDSSTTSESIKLFTTNFINVSDTTATSEVINVNDVELENISDTTVTSETVSTQIQSLIAISDTTTTSESITVFEPFDSVNVTDNTTTSENIVVVRPFLSVNVSDSTTTSENISIFEPFKSINVSDTTITSESAIVIEASANNRIIITNDAITTSEAVILLIPTLFKSVSDSTVTSEQINVNRSFSGNVNVSDTTTTSENVSLFIYSVPFAPLVYKITRQANYTFTVTRNSPKANFSISR